MQTLANKIRSTFLKNGVDKMNMKELYSKLSDGNALKNSEDEAKFKHSVRRAIQSLYAKGDLNRLGQGVYELSSKE
tara:strand:- start:380 stop:607 length:228 start_codon:yes stop_codon:yes gene_type:complete